ncbi:MAG: CDP-alcohol phosphatidyltransferase family protein [Steroidobacteraceae bacterium]
MLDGLMRPIIDPPLNRLARLIARTGVSANALTLAAVPFAIGAAAAIAVERYGLALLLIALNRLLDGIDGPLARIRGRSTDFGGYLDIVCDFVFYAAIPVGFGLADPRNLLPALVLLASFIGAGTSFLAFAVFAAKRGMETRAQGAKSFYFAAGLAEGTETIAAFVLACLWPAAFPQIAYVYAAICALTVVGRIIAARRDFGGSRP